MPSRSPLPSGGSPLRSTAFFATALLLAMLPAPGRAVTYHVDAATGAPDRTPSEAQNPATPWAHPNDALPHVTAGDTVLIAGGLYPGEFYITHPEVASGDEVVPVTPVEAVAPDIVRFPSAPSGVAAGQVLHLYRSRNANSGVWRVTGVEGADVLVEPVSRAGGLVDEDDASLEAAVGVPIVFKNLPGELPEIVADENEGENHGIYVGGHASSTNDWLEGNDWLQFEGLAVRDFLYNGIYNSRSSDHNVFLDLEVTVDIPDQGSSRNGAKVWGKCRYVMLINTRFEVQGWEALYIGVDSNDWGSWSYGPEGETYTESPDVHDSTWALHALNLEITGSRENAIDLKPRTSGSVVEGCWIHDCTTGWWNSVLQLPGENHGTLVYNNRITRTTVMPDGAEFSPASAVLVNLDEGAQGVMVYNNLIDTVTAGSGIRFTGIAEPLPQPPGGILACNTIVAADSSGIRIGGDGGADILLANNLLSGCGQALWLAWGDPASHAIHNHLLDGPTGLTGVDAVTAAPLFADPDSGDFRLSGASPAVDAGFALPWLQVSHDGVPVPEDPLDIGAFQYREPDAVPARHSPLPSALALSPPWPNPCNGASTLSFQLKHPAEVELRLYNALGRLVRRRDLGPRPAGMQRLALPLADLSSGSYVVQLHAAGQQQARRITLLK